VTDIGLNNKSLPALAADLLGRLLAQRLSSRHDDDFSPFLAKPKGDGFADAATTAGDHCHFASQALHFNPQFCETSGFL
jgi:hypothetical protein